MENRAQAALIVQLRGMIAGLDLAPARNYSCPTCGIRFMGPLTLSEHRYHSHGGPTPEHWLDTERMSG